jgi:hypothetical protein
MTNEQTTTLVLKDAEGHYVLVPQATLEQCRVPEEQSAALEQLLAEMDVSGYSARALYEVVTTVVWAAEFGATTIGKVLAGVAFEAAYGSPESPTVPA